MKRFSLLLTVCFFAGKVFSQAFDVQINQIADTLAKKILSANRGRVAVMDFINIDQSTTRLGVFLCDEISAELANKSQNQIKFRILERSSLDQIFAEKKLIRSIDGASTARQLGKVDAADALITGTITDFDGYYRVNIKLLDTKTGDALCAYKASFVKTPSLEKLNNELKESAPVTTAAPSTEIQKPVETKGDCSFSISAGNKWMCTDNIHVTLTSRDMPGVQKAIDIAYAETGHVYDMPPGIYQIEVVWGYSSGNVRGCNTDHKEIRITPGVNATIVLNYPK